MRGLALVALLVVGASWVQGQGVNMCLNRCNLVMCLQVTGNQVNIDTNANIARALLRDAYNDQTPKCLNRGANVGAMFYRDSIGDDDKCLVWPFEQRRNNKQRCLNTAQAAQNNDASTGNYLDVCLANANTDGGFLRVTHGTKCRYTVAIIADRDIENPAAAEAAANQLKAKGVWIVCFLVGNTQIARHNAYDKICAKTQDAEDYPALWRGVEAMFAELDCCSDPLLSPPTSPPGPCDGCKIRNGVGYNPNRDRCDCWNRCLFNEAGSVYSIMNCCQCGMFWDQNLLTCMPAADITCPADPCRDTAVTAYAYPGNCRGYWTCDGRRSNNALCCPPGEAFNPATQQCAPGTCTDPCPCDQETTTNVCPFRENPLDPHTYFVIGNPPVLMSCAPGTDFNATECKCSTFVTVHTPPCPADFDMRCTENPLVDHANDAYIANYDVDVNTANGQCIFGGPREHLKVPRFANYAWRNRFAIYSKFNGESNRNGDGPLFSNTDCNETKSVELRLKRDGVLPRIEAYIRIADDVFTTSLPYRPTEVNEAYMYYDGENLRLCVKYADESVDSSTVAATGMVRRCKCAAQIGYGWDEFRGRYFVGSIYDTRVYINCVPTTFCT